MKVFKVAKGNSIVARGNSKTAFEIAWLEIAKGLPIGRSTRIDHGHRSKKTLQINNNIDSWSCYCYACNDGRVVRKSSIRLFDRGTAVRGNLTVPGTSQAIHSLPGYIRDRIDIFLINKGITRDMILETGVCSLSYHMERDSLIFKLPDRVMVRSLSPSTMKWITSHPDNCYSILYDSPHGNKNHPSSVVVLEDLLSTLKTIFTIQKFRNDGRWNNSVAIGNKIPSKVICNYGTKVDYGLIGELTNYDCIVLGFDNDRAGLKASKEITQSCKLLNTGVNIKQIDIGKYNKGNDVKNLSILDIVSELKL